MRATGAEEANPLTLIPEGFDSGLHTCSYYVLETQPTDVARRVMIDDVEIYGVAFMSLYHHDGRFVRGGGVFAFSRRDLDGGRTILHLEPVSDISRYADSSHPRWDWATSNGMNELLVHLAGSQQTPGELAPGVGSPPIRWNLHPDEVASDDQIDEMQNTDAPSPRVVSARRI